MYIWDLLSRMWDLCVVVPILWLDRMIFYNLDHGEKMAILFGLAVIVLVIEVTQSPFRKVFIRMGLWVTSSILRLRMARLFWKRTKRMTRPEQEAHLRSLMADTITDALEDLEVQGKITRGDKLAWYKRFANVFSIPDLISKHQKILKEELKEKKEKRTGKSVSLPDLVEHPKTSKKQGVAPVKKQRFVDRIRQRM